MDKMILSKSDFPKVITEIIKKNNVYAPVKNNDTIIFDQIKKPSEMNLDFCNSKVPPKKLLFHQTETLFKFTPGTKAKIESVDINENNVIFGIRPCDAKGLAILDHAFQGDFEDPYFLKRRKNTTLIGLSCNKPELNCFCTSFDDSPASSKYVDILFTDIGDKYYVEIKNDKGKQLTKNISNLLKPATENDTKKRKEVEQKAINMISRHQTCMNPEYTLQASGYNPRPARTNRVRNRVYHKYNYYPKNYDVIACVGCGRCIDLCPVNIDIIDVVTRAGEVKP